MKQFTTRTLLIVAFFLAATALVLSFKVLGPGAPHDRKAALTRELKDLEAKIEQVSTALESAREKDLAMKEWLEKVARENPHHPVGEKAKELLERIWGPPKNDKGPGK